MDQNTDTPNPTGENQTSPAESQVTPQETTSQQSTLTGMDIPRDERMWGMFCHLAALAGFIGIPFANVIGPLIVWLIKKEDYDFVKSQGEESLNFQITVAIYAIICFVLFCIAIGPFLLAAVVLFDLVMIIIASIEANKGNAYRYPLCIRFFK